MLNQTILHSALLCPHCGAALHETQDGRSLHCTGARVHCFDISASGYLNFATPEQARSGDSKELVRARSAFLKSGYYSEFAKAICEAAAEYAPGEIAVDAGCGEGYYTLKLAEEVGYNICGFDLSRPAIDAASKSARSAFTVAEKVSAENLTAMRKSECQTPRPLYCVGGIFNLPLREGCADAVFNLFAPCAESEFSRVLKKSGRLILAGAGEDHLYGLKAALYDTPRKNTPRADLPANMKRIGYRRVCYDITLESHEDILSLFTMTPYFYRTGQLGFERLGELENLKTQVDFDIYIYENTI